ncbi:hypothetical protein VCHC41A1_3556, partial [Vibrio cholerae HC-41A1]
MAVMPRRDWIYFFLL